MGKPIPTKLDELVAEAIEKNVSLAELSPITVLFFQRNRLAIDDLEKRIEEARRLERK